MVFNSVSKSGFLTIIFPFGLIKIVVGYSTTSNNVATSFLLLSINCGHVGVFFIIDLCHSFSLGSTEMPNISKSSFLYFF